ncbi:MAG: hypothetical protein V7K83_21420 [Nostoc sp.]
MPNTSLREATPTTMPNAQCPILRQRSVQVPNFQNGSYPYIKF